MDALVQDLDSSYLNPPWGPLGRSLTLGLVSGWCKLHLGVLNHARVVNREALLKAVMDRPQGQGLVTICNHTSLLDDPGLHSYLLPWSYFWTDPLHHGMRWSMCAKEVCFKNEFLRQFFLNGKTLPIERGRGIDQPVMKVVASQVGQGGWLHVFPEGRIHFDGKLGPFRWGVGKVICDAKAQSGRDPVVLAFHHSGMGDIMPFKALPRAGQELVVTVGEPVDLSSITCRCNQPGVDQKQVWKDITAKLHDEMARLAAASPPNTDQVAARRAAKQAKVRAEAEAAANAETS